METSWNNPVIVKKLGLPVNVYILGFENMITKTKPGEHKTVKSLVSWQFDKTGMRFSNTVDLK